MALRKPYCCALSAKAKGTLRRLSKEKDKPMNRVIEEAVAHLAQAHDHACGKPTVRIYGRRRGR